MSQGARVSDIDEIRKQMAMLRLDMHRDVAGVVQDAESMFDWRSYIRNAPWVSMGAAFSLGYLLVPRRARRVVETSAPRTTSHRELDDNSSKSSALHVSLWGIAGTVLSLAAPVAIRAAQSYAVSWLEEQLLQGSGPGQTASGRSTEPSAADTRIGSRRSL